jgi:hypothetical protein
MIIHIKLRFFFRHKLLMLMYDAFKFIGFYSIQSIINRYLIHRFCEEKRQKKENRERRKN